MWCAVYRYQKYTVVLNVTVLYTVFLLDTAVYRLAVLTISTLLIKRNLLSFVHIFHINRLKFGKTCNKWQRLPLYHRFSNIILTADHSANDRNDFGHSTATYLSVNTASNLILRKLQKHINSLSSVSSSSVIYCIEIKDVKSHLWANIHIKHCVPRYFAPLYMTQDEEVVCSILSDFATIYLPLGKFSYRHFPE